jgi:hypothetical protein
MSNENGMSSVVYALGGVATNVAVDYIFRKQFPAMGIASQKLISGGLVASGGVATSYALESNNGNYFALGSLGYTATSLVYALVTKPKMSINRVVENPDDSVIIDGEAVPIATQGKFKLVDYTEQPEFDLTPTGKFNRRSIPIKRFVMHHGGYDPYHLATIFKGGRNASTHFGIGYDKDGSVIVAQYLDPIHQAWHAGNFNQGSIGVDFAMSPEVKNQARYNLPIVKTNSNRIKQPAEVLEVPDELVDAAAQFLKEMHRVLGIDMKVNLDSDALVTSYDELENSPLGEATVIGHHNIKPGRWDVFYLWDRLLERTNPQANV